MSYIQLSLKERFFIETGLKLKMPLNKTGAALRRARAIQKLMKAYFPNIKKKSKVIGKGLEKTSCAWAQMTREMPLTDGLNLSWLTVHVSFK